MNDHEYNHKFESYVQKAHQESRNQELASTLKSAKVASSDSINEPKMKIARIKGYTEEPTDFQAMADKASYIKAINIYGMLSDEIEGSMVFENGKLVYTTLNGLKVVGFVNIQNYNPTLIIKPKFFTNEICQHFGLELRTDEAQWLIYKLEADMNIEKRNPFLISVKQ